MFAGQFTEALHDVTLLAALGNKLTLLIGPQRPWRKRAAQ